MGTSTEISSPSATDRAQVPKTLAIAPPARVWHRGNLAYRDAVEFFGRRRPQTQSDLQVGLIGKPNQIAAVVAAMSGEPPVFVDPA